MCNVASMTTNPVLKHPPLKMVICQLRFPSVLGLTDADVRPLQVELEDEYPNHRADTAQQLEIKAPGNMELGETERIYRFADEADEWAVTFGKSALSLQTTAFTTFADYATRWERLIRYVAAQFNIGRQERLGLRFVNQVPLPSADAEGLRATLAGGLVGIVGETELTQELIQAMQEMRFKQTNGSTTIRHGLVPENDGPTPYVLDFDYYDDAPKHLELDEQMQRLRDYNDAMYVLLKTLVTQATFASFEPEEPASA